MENEQLERKEQMFEFNNQEATAIRLKFYYVNSEFRQCDMHVREMREFL